MPRTPLLLKSECALDLRLQLGEGPIWVGNALYFVDIVGQKIFRFFPRTRQLDTWDAPSKIAFILPTTHASFLCGMAEGLSLFAPEKGTFERVVPIDADITRTRLNDACVDAHGRAWFGSMDEFETDGRGVLYSLTHSVEGFRLERHDTGYIVANGPAVSPDGRTLYVSDTPRKVIHAYTITARASLEEKRTFATLEGDEGGPDGVVTDSVGNVWSGCWGGGSVIQFSPQGERLAVVRFPCTNVTKVAFGGRDYRSAFVTTARQGVPHEKLAREPQAGGVFKFTSPVAGRPVNLFKMVH